MRVSVILPTYNRMGVLEVAVESVITQSFVDLELLVVDDGSTDGTAEYLENLARRDARVRWFRVEHGGAAIARNFGLSKASGRYVAFQDSDDEWSTQFLERLMPYSGEGILVFASHMIRGRDDRSKVVPAHFVTDPARALRRGNIISTQTVVADRRLFESVQFDATLSRYQDWDLWLSLVKARRIRFVHVPEILVTVRRQVDSISEGSPDMRDRALRYIWRKHRSVFAADPCARARLFARGWLRPLGRRLGAALRWAHDARR